MKIPSGRLLVYGIVPACIIQFVKKMGKGKEGREGKRDKGSRKSRGEGNTLSNCVTSFLPLRGFRLRLSVFLVNRRFKRTKTPLLKFHVFFF